jgi:hypothetical protein
MITWRSNSSASTRFTIFRDDLSIRGSGSDFQTALAFGQNPILRAIRCRDGTLASAEASRSDHRSTLIEREPRHPHLVGFCEFRKKSGCEVLIVVTGFAVNGILADYFLIAKDSGAAAPSDATHITLHFPLDWD